MVNGRHCYSTTKELESLLAEELAMEYLYTKIRSNTQEFSSTLLANYLSHRFRKGLLRQAIIEGNGRIPALFAREKIYAYVIAALAWCIGERNTLSFIAMREDRLCQKQQWILGELRLRSNKKECNQQDVISQLIIAQIRCRERLAIISPPVVLDMAYSSCIAGGLLVMCMSLLYFAKISDDESSHQAKDNPAPVILKAEELDLKSENALQPVEYSAPIKKEEKVENIKDLEFQLPLNVKVNKESHGNMVY